MKKARKIILNIACVLVIILCIVVLLNNKTKLSGTFGKFGDKDKVEQVDLNKLTLSKGKVTVDFSEVLLSKQEERRKLIISEQSATVTSTLTYKMVKELNLGFLEKTQDVKYVGKASFVVDLDNLTKDRIIDDKENKTLTIIINHAHLDTIEIDPKKIEVGDVKEGFFARGDIMLSVADYKILETNLIKQMKEKINSPSNAQEADVKAREAVVKIYEPVVKAIDDEYAVLVEFVK